MEKKKQNVFDGFACRRMLFSGRFFGLVFFGQGSADADENQSGNWRELL